MKNEPQFLKCDDTHEYYCILTEKAMGGRQFVGKATCHPDDYDLESEKVGFSIALQRAAIKALKWYKNVTLTEQYKAIKQYYNSIKQSKHFDPKGYEAKMLYRAINRYESDIQMVKDTIIDSELTLREYLQAKEIFRDKIRESRAEGENK